MSSQGSVTNWIRSIQRGAQGEAQEEIFDRFFARLVGLARKKLGNLRAYEDEHDIALSAMKTFFHRAPAGQFPKLTDRNSLWSLLAAITLNKAVSLQRRQLAQGRDVRRNQSLEAILRDGPSDELLDSVFEEGNRLLEGLGDEAIKTVARLRMEGYTNQEIANQMDVSIATVKRKLRIIRERLEDELTTGSKQE